ncbi:MAG: hypothetical protein KDA73_09635 [Rhodobacteraceae bacterium]|nr:hypothetical protein [Paracoccaceae bacterium]
MRRALALLLAVSLVAAVPARAELRHCKTSLNGAETDLVYDSADTVVAGNRSLSERTWAMFGSETCPGYVTLRALTPELTDVERGPFCLVYDSDSQTFTGFAQGERDAYRICTQSRSFCERVNDSADAALEIAGLSDDPDAASLGDTAAQGAAAAQSGYDAIRDTAAGATIISGTGSYIAGALGNAGAAALAALSAPATLAAAAVTVVAVGGAVYVCR